MSAPATLPLSVIVALRDPTYAGDLLGRFRVFTRALLEGARRKALRGELIVVEWNPPRDKPSFHRSWQAQVPVGDVRIRFVVVPPEVHTRFPNSDEIPIHEYIAKNVGLRRSAGAHVLATNPDLVFNEALIEFLASGQFARDTFYRIDREDLGASVPPELSVDEQIEFCRRHVTRLHTRFGSLDVRRSSRLLGAAAEAVRRLEILNAYLLQWRGRPLPRLRRERLLSRISYPSDWLHRNAAGDFLLMSRDSWDQLQGYPELTTHAHIDSILLWGAASAGLSQKILRPPKHLYHQLHGRAEQRAMPKTNWLPWYETYKRAKASGEPIRVNDERWGLRDEQFEEWVVPAGSPAGTRPVLK